MANSLNLNWSKCSVKMLGLWKEEKWTNQWTTLRARLRTSFKLCWHTRKEKWSRAFVTEVRVEWQRTSLSNRQLTALYLFPIIFSKGQSHGLVHGQIMTYSFQFPLVTNHHMRTENSCVCPCQGINLVLNNDHIFKQKSLNWRSSVETDQRPAPCKN